MTDTVASSLVGDIYTSVSPYNLCSTDKAVNADVKTHVESAIARYVTDASTQKSLLQGVQSAFVNGCRFTDVYSSKKFIREAVQLARTKPVKDTADDVQPKNSSISCSLQHTAITGGTISKATISKAVVIYTLDDKEHTESITDGTIEVKDATIITGEVTGGTCSKGTIKGKALNGATIEDTAFTASKLTNVKLLNRDTYTSVSLLDVSLKKATIAETDIGETKKSDTLPVSTESKNIPYAGDLVQFKVDVPGFQPIGSTSNTTVTGNEGSCFQVTRDVGVNEYLNNKSPMLIGHFVDFKDDWRFDCNKSDLPTNIAYIVRKDTVADFYQRYRSGWVYGVMVTPFKFIPAFSRTSTGATVGPYVGLRLYDSQGLSTSLAISAGLTSAQVTSTAGDKTNLIGTSLAVAYLVNIKSSFNVGILVGTDLFEKGVTRPDYAGKAWIGVNIGYALDD
ncbi:MAG: hypothetical protein Q9M09_02840 [Mariprofundaceae bacterium]|nr:hypothetical protein [Mariprofundaceae bacterium]